MYSYIEFYIIMTFNFKIKRNTLMFVKCSNKATKMSSFIQCTTYGKVVAEYSCEGMIQSEKQNKENAKKPCCLYEYRDF